MMKQFEMTVAGSQGRTYQVYKAQDGAWVCSCPSWKFQRNVPGSLRTCKHLTKLTLDLAGHVNQALAVRR